MSDGRYGTGDLPVTSLRSPNGPHNSLPSKRYTVTSRSASPLKETLSTSLIDTCGNDTTNGVPDNEGSKIWSQRSLKEMAEFGTIPAGLPTGITDTEKKLWLALYCQARKLLADGKAPTVRKAVDAALNDPAVCVVEKYTIEYRFGVRWQHSICSCLAMRQPFRSSDVYS